MTLRSAAASRLLVTAAALLATHALMAQVPAATPAPSKPLQQRPIPVVPPTADHPDRAAAYYHDGLAHLYEELAISNGRPDYASQAVEEYKLALNADPGSKYLQEGLADLYFKIGRIREAVNAAQDEVKKDPNDVEAHTLLGKVYLRSLNDMQGPQAQEMLQLAIAEYEKISQLKPKDTETHLLLGQLYGVNHDTAKAEQQFKIARGLDANSDEAVIDMARLYADQGEPQQAIQTLTAVPPEDRSARMNLMLGTSYDQTKEFKKAAAAYKAALEDDSDNADTQRALATALANDDQLAEALSVYQQLVQNDAGDAGTELKIADLQRRLGHYQDALDSLNKAKTLGGNTDNLQVAFQEAALYDALGRFDQAVTALQGALKDTEHLDRKYTDPEKSNRAIFLDRLAIVYNEQNKTADAVATYKQMVELGGPYVVQGSQGEIDSYRASHQWKEALAVAADLAKQLPNDSRVQMAYAQQLADSGQTEQALTLAKAQLNDTSPSSETFYSLAVIDYRVHRDADALADLDKAEKLATQPQEHLGFEVFRAQILEHQKRYDDAEAEYKKAMAIDATNPTVLNNYGYMLAERGVRLDDALAMIKKAVELDPQNGSYLDSLGWVYYKLGQYGPAEQNLHQAIDRTPTDASIHDHLGEVYEKTGRLKLAVDQWERSMTEYAHSLPADADPADVAKVKQKLDQARVKLARVNTPGKKS
jgi:tetratricopeptide (TPR) repeat protein